MDFLRDISVGQWVFIVLLVIVTALALIFHENVKKGVARLGQFYREVRLEMKKVSWPSRQEVIGSTVIVLFTVVVLSFLIFGEDTILVKIAGPLFTVR